MKILVVTWQVGQGDEQEQLRRRRIDAGNLTTNHLRMGDGIVDLDRIWLVQQGREVAVSFSQRGHRGEDIIRIRAARAAVVSEEKCFCSAVVDVRNVQRAADRGAKVVSVIGGPAPRLSGNGAR